MEKETNKPAPKAAFVANAQTVNWIMDIQEGLRRRPLLARNAITYIL